jgi:hypothetical protein
MRSQKDGGLGKGGRHQSATPHSVKFLASLPDATVRPYEYGGGQLPLKEPEAKRNAENRRRTGNDQTIGGCRRRRMTCQARPQEAIRWLGEGEGKVGTCRYGSKAKLGR